jgi:uncharacterized membrane protein YphA (DoxX/SURF4 family)
MNTLLWIAQILLAGVFLFRGVSKLLAYEELVKAPEMRGKAKGVGMSPGLASIVGLLELAGAVGVVLPVDPWPPYILLRLAAAGLALLMVVAGIYHIRRQETAAPSVTLFLLALFVIIGRSRLAVAPTPVRPD